MKTKALKTISGVSLAIVMLAVFAQVRVPAQGQSGNPQGLIGSWIVQVTIRDCQSGTPFFGFPAMITYNQGGTMQETDLGDPSLLRLAGYGVWERQSGQQYSATFQFLNFNLDRSPAGKNVVRSAITLGPTGNEYQSTDTAEIFDTAGNLIVRGCSTTAATRIQ